MREPPARSNLFPLSAPSGSRRAKHTHAHSLAASQLGRRRRGLRYLVPLHKGADHRVYLLGVPDVQIVLPLWQHAQRRVRDIRPEPLGVLLQASDARRRCQKQGQQGGRGAAEVAASSGLSACRQMTSFAPCSTNVGHVRLCASAASQVKRTHHLARGQRRACP